MSYQVTIVKLENDQAHVHNIYNLHILIKLIYLN